MYFQCVKRSPLTHPDEFSQSPLFSILPRYGDCNSLLKMKGAFFARKENLLSSHSIDTVSADKQREQQKKIDCEVRMLSEVLVWIEERSL